MENTYHSGMLLTTGNNNKIIQLTVALKKKKKQVVAGIDSPVNDAIKGQTLSSARSSTTLALGPNA